MSSARSPKSHFSKVLGDGEGGHIHSLLKPERISQEGRLRKRRFPTMPKTLSLASSSSHPSRILGTPHICHWMPSPGPRAPSSTYHPIPNTLDSPEGAELSAVPAYRDAPPRKSQGADGESRRARTYTNYHRSCPKTPSSPSSR